MPSSVSAQQRAPQGSKQLGQPAPVHTSCLTPSPAAPRPAEPQWGCMHPTTPTEALESSPSHAALSTPSGVQGKAQESWPPCKSRYCGRGPEAVGTPQRGSLSSACSEKLSSAKLRNVLNRGWRRCSREEAAEEAEEEGRLGGDVRGTCRGCFVGLRPSALALPPPAPAAGVLIAC